MNWLKCLKSFWWHVIANIYTQHTSKCAHTQTHVHSSHSKAVQKVSFDLIFIMVCGRTFPLAVEPGILLQTCTWRLIKSFSYSVELAIKQQLLDYTPTYHHDKEKPHQRAHVVLTQKGRTCTPCLKKTKTKQNCMPAAAYQTRSVAIIWSLQRGEWN